MSQMIIDLKFIHIGMNIKYTLKSNPHRFLKEAIFLCFWILGVSFFANGQNLRISGSNGHSVIICSNGSVFAWGSNAEGQIGLGPDGVTPYPNAYYSTPQRVYGLSEIYQVDAGSGGHTLALTCDGQVVSWGRNDYGQLGGGNKTSHEAKAVYVRGVGGTGNLTGVSYVSGGNDESFAIMQDGRLVAWGQNDKGQLGDGTTTERLAPVYVLTAAGTPLTNVIMVEAGDENGYALTADGTVYSWGDAADNSGLALGRPLANNAYARPVQKEGGGNLTNIVSISAGDRHCLAIDADGYLWAWGGDWGHGQVGDGYNTGGYYTQPFATRVIAGETASAPALWKTEFLGGPSNPVVSIAAGQAHSIAALADGRVLTWGSNGNFNCGTDCSTPAGQLGVGNRFTTHAAYGSNGDTENTAPLVGRLCDGTVLTNVVEVSDGDAWTFALTGDGKIYVTGWNQQGQLGIGSTNNSFCFRELTIPDCGITAPCPNPDLGPDFEACPGFTKEFNVGTVYSGFEVRWYLDGVLKATEVVTGTPKQVSYEVDGEFGEWKVEIEDKRNATERPCEPCELGVATVTISEWPIPFTLKELYWCNNTMLLSVNGTGGYTWHTKPIGGTKIGSTSKGDTTFIDPTPFVADLEYDAAAETYTVYIEDTTIFEITTGLRNSVGLSNPDNNGVSGDNSYLRFDLLKPVSIEEISVNIRKYNSPSSVTLEIRNSGGTIVASGTANSPGAGDGFFPLVVPINSATLPIGTYTIVVTNGAIQSYENGFSYPTSYDGIISYVDNHSSFNQYNKPNHLPYYFDWKVKSGSDYPCGRIAVEIPKDCPPCVPPQSVTMQGPDTINICIEEGLTLNFDTDTIADGALEGYVYTWFFKDRSTPVTGFNQKAFTSNQGDQEIEFPSIALADSGWYYVRVEDGITGDATCYLEDSVLVVVHGKPLPELMSEDLDAMCEEESRHIRVKDALSTSKYSYRLEDANGATLTLFPEDDSVNVTAGTGAFDLWLIEETEFGCKDSVVYTIDVDHLPTPALITTVIPDTLAFCASENPKNIIGNVPTIGTGEWKSADAAYGFGDPSSATTTLTGLNGDAEFKIWWTISNGVCPPSSDTVVVQGTNFVTPAVSLAVNENAICEGTELTFKATGVNGGDNPLYTFYASDGSVLQAQSTSDEYVVSSPTADLEVYVEMLSNSTCLAATPGSDLAESDVVTVEVDTRPSTVSLPGDTTVCSDKVNLTVTLSGSEGTGGWGVVNSIIGSFTDPLANPGEFVFNSEGETEVYYLNTSQRGHCPEESDTITVKKTGNLTSAEPGPDIEVCVDEPVELNGNNVDLANEHVWWEALGSDKSNPDASGIVMTFPLPLGPTDSSKAEVTSFPALAAGVAEIEYYFVYHIRSRHGDCVSRDTLAVRILNTPNQPGPVSGETEICSGSSSTYGVAAVPGATEGYEWSFAPAGLARVVSGDGSNGVSIIFDENGTVTSPTVVEIIVKAKNQCDTGPERRLAVTINPQVTPVLSLSQSSPSVCAGDAMTFTATVSGHTPGDAYYQWYHGSSALAGATTSTLMLDNLVNGDEVRVVVFVTNECAVTPQLSESVQVAVTDTVPVRVSLDADDYEPCDGQTVVFTAIGQPGSGGSYSWYHNGTLQASASASASFVMNGSGTEDSVRVVYTYNGACPGPSNPGSASLVLTPTDLVPVAVSLDAAGPICLDHAAETFTATKVHSEPGNSGSYRWRIGTGAYVSGSSTYTMPFLQPGVYTVEVEFTSGLKCVVDRTVTDQATYEVFALPAPAISGGRVYCPGEAITLTGVPTNIGSTFSWSYTGASGIPTTLGTALTESAGNEGLYVFLERDPNGCEGRARQIVEEFDADVEITATPGTMKCEGDSVYLSTRLATTYTWTLDGNATSFTDRNIWVIEPGEYEVTLVLNSGSTQCTGNGSITITDRPRPEPVILEPGDTICETEGYVLTVSDMANLSNPTISWYVMGESGMIGSASDLAVNSSGQYYAIMSYNGCPRSSDTVEVIADRAVKAVVQPREQYIEEGEIAGLNGLSSVNAYTYTWSSIQYEGLYSPDEESGFIQVQPRESMNVFVLEVKGEYGKCVSRDSGYVFVEKDVRPWNSFSPNGDGMYDEWIIEGLSTYPNALVEVYNRWGTLVWRSEGYEQPWRGENFRNGQPLPVATYYYVIYPNGGKVKKPRSGDVTIVK